MKTQITKPKTKASCLLGIIAGIALAGSGLQTMADDLIVNSFDTSLSGIDWQNFRSYIYGQTEVWDGTQDSHGDPSSGSMYLTVNWPLKSDPNWNQNWNDVQIAFYTGSFNSSDYIQFDIDIKIDVTNSFPAVDGTYGALELIVNNPWTTVVGWASLQPTGDWQHIQGFFSGIPDGTYSEAVIGLISNGGSTLTNTVAYWIDNVVFTAPPSVHTNRPPLTIAKAPPPGLTCIASQPGGTYQRQMLASVNSNYSWDTATAVSNTTTYSISVASFPVTNYAGFTAQMFMIPQAGMIGQPIDLNIDWDSADVAALYVGRNADGSGSGTFQYKINNSSSWNTALVVTKPCAAGPLGKWSLSFNHNTNVTITAPDNTVTNFTIPASDAAHFADPLFVYCGAQPNNNASIGEAATLSSASVTGSAGSIVDNFTTLDTSTWAFNAADPNGVFITAPDARFWVSWPLPDGGFTNLYATENLTRSLANSQWASLPVSATGWLNVGGVQRLTVINQSTLNTAFSHTPTNCFMGLFHQ